MSGYYKQAEKEFLKYEERSLPYTTLFAKTSFIEGFKVASELKDKERQDLSRERELFTGLTLDKLLNKSYIDYETYLASCKLLNVTVNEDMGWRSHE